MFETVPSTKAIMGKRHFARCWMRCLAFGLVGLGSIWLLYDLVSIMVFISGNQSRFGGMQSFDEVWALMGGAVGKSLTTILPGLVVWIFQKKLARGLVPIAEMECPECGYALRQLREARCPECGLGLPGCVVDDEDETTKGFETI